MLRESLVSVVKEIASDIRQLNKGLESKQQTLIPIDSQIHITEDREISLVPSSRASEERPSSVMVGYMYFDTTLNCPIFWDGNKWVKIDGGLEDKTNTGY